MKVLVVDVGGTHVKILATSEDTRREFPSSPKLTGDRPGPLRRSNLARLPSPRHPLLGGPRLPRAPPSAFPPGGGSGRSLKSGGVFSRSCSAGSGTARSADDRSPALIHRSAHPGCDQVVLGGADEAHFTASAPACPSRTWRPD